MSIRFSSRASMGVRGLGAIIGAGFGVVAVVLGVVFASGSGATSTLVLGAEVLALATPLGWLFARRAVQPGVWSAFTAAAGITAVAVPLGAIGVGILMGLGADNMAPSEAVLGALAVAFLGLMFLGLPLAGLTFFVASLWVGALRLVAGWLAGGRSYDITSEDWPATASRQRTPGTTPEPPIVHSLGTTAVEQPVPAIAQPCACPNEQLPLLIEPTHGRGVSRPMPAHAFARDGLPSSASVRQCHLSRSPKGGATGALRDASMTTQPTA